MRADLGGDDAPCGRGLFSEVYNIRIVECRRHDLLGRRDDLPNRRGLFLDAHDIRFGGSCRRRLFGLSIGTAGLALSLLALIPNMVIAVMVTLVLGAFAGVAWVTGYTLLGLEVADEVRGRTFAFVQTMAATGFVRGKRSVRAEKRAKASVKGSGADVTPAEQP